MDAGMEVMPTTVKQANKQMNKNEKTDKKNVNIAIVKKSTKKLPSDIVLKISSKESKKVYCAMMLIVFCFFKTTSH